MITKIKGLQCQRRRLADGFYTVIGPTGTEVHVSRGNIWDFNYNGEISTDVEGIDEKMDHKTGQIQIYTGDGKGKTTSSIGLMIRAAGAGMHTTFIQFDKGSEGEDFYSERKILKLLENIVVIPTGKIRMMPTGQFRFANSPPDFEEAKRGLEIAKKTLASKKSQLVICDEILSCLLTGLLKEQDVLDLIEVYEKTGRSCDLVLTGRSLPEKIKEKADLISEIKMVKHYFNKGLPARKGIEF